MHTCTETKSRLKARSERLEEPGIELTGPGLYVLDEWLDYIKASIVERVVMNLSFLQTVSLKVDKTGRCELKINMYTLIP